MHNSIIHKRVFLTYALGHKLNTSKGQKVSRKSIKKYSGTNSWVTEYFFVLFYGSLNTFYTFFSVLNLCSKTQVRKTLHKKRKKNGQIIILLKNLKVRKSLINITLLISIPLNNTTNQSNPLNLWMHDNYLNT
jgi:hypothetical protein